MEPVRAGLRVEARHRRLCSQIASLREPSVADVMRTFLEVSTLPGEEGLWSLEFGFDEDTDRIARLDARFWDPRLAGSPDGALPGYEVQLLLPKALVARSPEDPAAAAHMLATAAVHGNLVARFIRSLTELGAYLRIEPVQVLSADARLVRIIR